MAGGDYQRSGSKRRGISAIRDQEARKKDGDTEFTEIRTQRAQRKERRKGLRRGRPTGSW
jgi:hypothetical protein